MRDLGKSHFTWRDLSVIVRNLPRSSALARSFNVDAELGTPEVQLLAAVADSSAMNAWLQTEDASKGVNRPKPVLRQLIQSRGEPAQTDLEYDEAHLAYLDDVFSRPRIPA